jgi:hypothetical protein
MVNSAALALVCAYLSLAKEVAINNWRASISSCHGSLMLAATALIACLVAVFLRLSGRFFYFIATKR